MTRSLLATVLGFLIVTSCNTQKAPQPDPLPEITAQPDDRKEPLQKSAVEAAYSKDPVSYIISNTTPRHPVFNTKDFDQLTAIDTNFLDRYIFGLKPGPQRTEELPRETWGNYYWYQHFRHDSILYFSVIHQNEYCCAILYGFTAHTDSFNIIDVHEIGLSGGDGGWVETDSGKWTSDTTLSLLKAESYAEEEYYSDSTNLIIDSTWLYRGYSLSGKFYQLLKDTSSVVQRVAR